MAMALALALAGHVAPDVACALTQAQSSHSMLLLLLPMEAMHRVD